MNESLFFLGSFQSMTLNQSVTITLYTKMTSDNLMNQTYELIRYTYSPLCIVH